MAQIKTEVETFARIKVLGVGGSGLNALNHMVSSKVDGVEFVAINTDAQDLHMSPAKRKVHIGKNLTRGLGAGMNPSTGKRAAEETREELQEVVKGADMVFIACGLGGGTGSGASPVIAKISKESGALTVAVVTKPFWFEGPQRNSIAETALEELRAEVDAIIVIPNDRLLSSITKETTAKNAFSMCDDVLKSAVEGISDLITTPGIINIDFADIRAIMQDAGSALLGIGVASGENRAEVAAKAAINSPLLDISINGASGILFSIAGGDDLTMFEIQEAAKIITEAMDPSARIIFGTVKDDDLKKGDIKVTVIATGFPESVSPRRPQFAAFEAKRDDRSNEQAAANAPQPATPPVQPKEKEREEEPAPQRGRIFNTGASAVTPEPAKTPTDTPADDNDDWGAVPAFLRRKKM